MDDHPTTDHCRYCLMCRHVCPVGHVTQLETLTPHGWALTIASVQRGLLTWNAETVDVLYSCADCGLCRANCVTDQPLPNAIAAARAEVTARQLAPATVYEIGEMLKRYENPHIQQIPPRLAKTGRVALFVGDDARYRWPSGVAAAQTLIWATGVEPVEIGIGRNNGYLASSLGFPDTARALVQASLDELRESGAQKMLVLSPGDYFAFAEHLRERLGLSWPEEVELIELTTYLVDQLKAGTFAIKSSGGEATSTYVDPTHAVRVTAKARDTHAARTLLGYATATPSQELFWRKDRAHPVGSTALQFTQPQLAERLTRARLEDARTTGAQVLVCEDAGTLAQLARFASDYGLQVKGLYELVAEKF
jgi:Fe-S oxidoreductase